MFFPPIPPCIRRSHAFPRSRPVRTSPASRCGGSTTRTGWYPTSRSARSGPVNLRFSRPHRSSRGACRAPTGPTNRDQRVGGAKRAVSQSARSCDSGPTPGRNATRSSVARPARPPVRSDCGAGGRCGPHSRRPEHGPSFTGRHLHGTGFGVIHAGVPPSQRQSDRGVRRSLLGLPAPPGPGCLLELPDERRPDGTAAKADDTPDSDDLDGARRAAPCNQRRGVGAPALRRVGRRRHADPHRGVVRPPGVPRQQRVPNAPRDRHDPQPIGRCVDVARRVDQRGRGRPGGRSRHPGLAAHADRLGPSGRGQPRLLGRRRDPVRRNRRDRARSSPRGPPGSRGARRDSRV